MSKVKQHSVVQKSYQCEFCGVKCRRPQDLRRHLLVHSEASFQCDGCGHKFTRYDTLMRHKRDNCRHAQSAWTDRHGSNDHYKPVAYERPTHIDLPAPVQPAPIAFDHRIPHQSNGYQFPSPLHFSSSSESLSITPEPLISPPANYGPTGPAYAPMQPLLNSIEHQQVQFAPAVPVHMGHYQLQPPWPPTPVAMNPPNMGPTGPPEQHSVYTAGISPMIRYPEAVPSPESPPVKPTYVLKPSGSPLVIATSSSGSSSNTGAGARRSSYFSHPGSAVPTTPPHEVPQELPRIIGDKFHKPWIKNEKGLQPLEPNPSRFNDSMPPRFQPKQSESMS